MKRKLIISLFTLLMLLFVMGAGTYAWFTARVESTGNTISAGTFRIGASYKNKDSYKLFELSNVYPQEEPSSDNINPITVSNTGSMPVNINAQVDVSSNKSSGAENRKEFRIDATVVIKHDGAENELTSGSMSMDGFKSWLEEKVKNITLNANSDDAINIGGKVWLNEGADNSYQGKTINVGVSFLAEQVKS